MPPSSLIPWKRFTRDQISGIPHLSTAELLIWNKYLLSDLSKDYEAFDYDIKVGQNAVAAIKNPTPENMLQLGTLAKRIDAVGFLATRRVDLFEIKPERVANAVGQLLLYQSLFIETFPGFTIRKLIAVVGQSDLELDRFAKMYDITVVVV